jgi:hypothetical protein
MPVAVRVHVSRLWASVPTVSRPATSSLETKQFISSSLGRSSMPRAYPRTVT